MRWKYRCANVIPHLPDEDIEKPEKSTWDQLLLDWFPRGLELSIVTMLTAFEYGTLIIPALYGQILNRLMAPFSYYLFDVSMFPLLLYEITNRRRYQLMYRILMIFFQIFICNTFYFFILFFFSFHHYHFLSFIINSSHTLVS